LVYQFSSENWQLYEAFSAGKSSPLLNPIQYVDFAWQRQWLQGEVLETQLACWKQQLEGKLPVLELPTDRPVRQFKLSGAQQSWCCQSLD